MSDNRADCFKVLKAFKENVSRDEKENKKDEYDFKWLQQDKDSCILSNTLQDFIKEKKNKRSSHRSQKTVTMDQVEKEFDNNLGTTLD